MNAHLQVPPTTPGAAGPATVTRLRAVKLLKNGATADDKERFLSEAVIMLAFAHPNVVRPPPPLPYVSPLPPPSVLRPNPSLLTLTSFVLTILLYLPSLVFLLSNLQPPLD